VPAPLSAQKLDPARPARMLEPGAPMNRELVGLWLPLALWLVWTVFMVALGVYALGLKHSKLWVAIIIKTLGAIARPRGRRIDIRRANGILSP